MLQKKRICEYSEAVVYCYRPEGHNLHNHFPERRSSQRHIGNTETESVRSCTFEAQVAVRDGQGMPKLAGSQCDDPHISHVLSCEAFHMRLTTAMAKPAFIAKPEPSSGLFHTRIRDMLRPHWSPSVDGSIPLLAGYLARYGTVSCTEVPP